MCVDQKLGALTLGNAMSMAAAGHNEHHASTGNEIESHAARQ